MCAVVTVIFGVCNSVRLSQLFVVTFCKRQVNPITNPNPVYSHSITWQYIIIQFLLHRKQTALLFIVRIIGNVWMHCEGKLQSLKDKAGGNAGCLLLAKLKMGAIRSSETSGVHFYQTTRRHIYSARFTSGLRRITKCLYTVCPLPVFLWFCLWTEQTARELLAHTKATYECGALICRANMPAEAFWTCSHVTN
jgi:hypothetical protein